MAATANLNIIKAQPDVADITSKATAMLASVCNAYSCEKNVLIHETIHGHIAVMTRMRNSYVPGYESVPLRLDSSDFAFFGSLPGFRWVEATARQISIGF